MDLIVKNTIYKNILISFVTFYSRLSPKQLHKRAELKTITLMLEMVSDTQIMARTAPALTGLWVI